MSNQFVYIKNIVSNGFSFPEFDNEQHERFVYTELTGRLILLDAEGEKFDKNEGGILDLLVARAQESWSNLVARAA